MKRLLLSVLSGLIIAALSFDACASQYVFPDYPDVFWNELVYMGEEIDISVPPPGDLRHDTWKEKIPDINVWWETERADTDSREGYYRHYLYENAEVCDTLTWRDITFTFTKEPLLCYMDMKSELVKWQRFFNEMYYDAQRKILNDAGFSPFWEGMRFNGKTVDPFEAPPNYTSELEQLDHWKDERDDIGYAWYWSYYFIDVKVDYDNSKDNPRKKKKAKEPVWTWYGAAFDPEREPPGVEIRIDTDPFYMNRGYTGRSNIDYWEDYFNGLYYQNVPQPDAEAGEYYAWIKIRDRDSYLNARKKAASSSKSLAKLEYGHRVIVVGKPDRKGWVKVIYDMNIKAEKLEDGTFDLSAKPRYGYVQEKYLSKEPL